MLSTVLMICYQQVIGLESGIPQGFILRPFLFNIYLKGLSFLTEFTDLFNFADDTTFYASNKKTRTR